MELLFILLDPEIISQNIRSQNNTTVISIFRNDFPLVILRSLQSFWSSEGHLKGHVKVRIRNEFWNATKKSPSKWKTWITSVCEARIMLSLVFSPFFVNQQIFYHWSWNPLKTTKSSFVIILFYFIWDILQIIQKVFNFIMW